jgi:hypothetical protein
MIRPTLTQRYFRALLGGLAAGLALFALTAMSPPAGARGWGSVGGPCCGYWGPGSYYGYYPPPYAYAPPPGYYDPSAVPGAYSVPSAYAPTQPAYAPQTGAAEPSYAPAQPIPAYTPQASIAVPSAPATPTTTITYTNKPAFTNSSGQLCREYKTSDGGRDVYGTACRQADGQWRVTN